MTLKIEMLRCFAMVAECGNLADAGHRLSRSQAAVSMTLKQLEEHLGKPLFETDRKSKLTVLGEFVLEQAENELRQFDRSVQTIEHHARTGAERVNEGQITLFDGVGFAIEDFSALCYVRDQLVLSCAQDAFGS